MENRAAVQCRTQSADENEEEPSRKKQAFSLKQGEEDEIVDWYQENILLYDQSHKEFKNSKKKDRLFQEKAKQYGYTGQQLKSWFTNMRTMFGKLLRKKSGQGRKPHTARQTWILERFRFLKRHMQLKTSPIQLGMVSMSLY